MGEVSRRGFLAAAGATAFAVAIPVGLQGGRNVAEPPKSRLRFETCNREGFWSGVRIHFGDQQVFVSEAVADLLHVNGIDPLAEFCSFAAGSLEKDFQLTLAEKLQVAQVVVMTYRGYNPEQIVRDTESFYASLPIES